jgi:YgiT-type zinc finger domain-containing protein
MAARPQDEDTKSMKCEMCGAELVAVTTDLPFKVREPGIVILKGVPVWQCARCPQYLLEDEVLRGAVFRRARGRRHPELDPVSRAECEENRCNSIARRTPNERAVPDLFADAMPSERGKA